MKTHEDWMLFACQLAQSAEGQTAPNPMVGAVVVRDGCLVGSGAHLKAGTPHAEVHALNMAGKNAVGATIYVTLEPCNHHGRTPPCTERIIASGIKRVIVGSLDPDEKVAGRGIDQLKQAGLEVIVGVLEERCFKMNEAYFHHRRTGKPWVTLKTATTLDGKIATAVGDSRWITGEKAREKVHELRRSSDAILVGVGTVLADDPLLTTRLEAGGKNPIRVIIDSQLRTPLDAAITDVEKAATWIYTTDRHDPQVKQQLKEKGVRVVSTGAGSQVDLDIVLQDLGKQGILSLLVEGGGRVNASLLQERRVQKVVAFIAPKLLGGKLSPTSVEGESPFYMKDAISLRDVTITQIGEDFCIEGLI
ncbi:bifunctional diaminohydroxyphosphoribosylaminopyrimidine deaminase/5-amino-6-(5-phosphoribosylamino)uracil reductase RibD [Hazenella coriacea]|uniref:Riboflavin biosynthesis protein RibD n=1 Tax=Hazenella coriacea TaxID=1179467 RepID=A0A4R3LE27_9BACL|nr:bifunctional diaminohydroxyphosphoribosylaminopyrimidine deaminase/5-amino-6-(5-phosphoribosylamino)uracil reductase RibD [Hazenella coriacea]TCS96584.1 diaminohydroxyphosphoribosylaminopyrimidine deaminase/5-amino-6-(5-phosphoribosylamino)uracil reductase [Hazenella coriacea]